jgi:hypothetical protein
MRVRRVCSAWERVRPAVRCSLGEHGEEGVWCVIGVLGQEISG